MGTATATAGGHRTGGSLVSVSVSGVWCGCGGDGSGVPGLPNPSSSVHWAVTMGVGAANDRRVKQQAEGKIWRERECAGGGSG